MKQSNPQRLVAYLANKKQWCKAEELSAYLGVSTRMIRKYVTALNQTDSTKIHSSHQGYRLNPTASSSETTSHTPAYRIQVLLYQLLVHEQPIHLTQFAQQLFVSELTIKKDFQTVRQQLKSYQLTLVVKQDFYTIAGCEQKKRKLMRQLLDEETKETTLNKGAIQQLIKKSGIDLVAISQVVQQVTAAHGLFLNELSLNNLYLHLLVAINRVQTRHPLAETVADPALYQTKEYQVATSLAQQLVPLGVKFNEAEIYYLTLLLVGNNTIMQPTVLTMADLKKYIGADYFHTIQQILTNVYNLYYIDFSEEDFLVRFIIHLKNLSVRATYELHAHNPLQEEIKHTYPLIYDISVYIASEIATYTHTVIPESEIAFIALHLGAYLESRQREEQRIRAILVAPHYQEIAYLLSQKISEQFADTLMIQKVLPTTEDLSKYEQDHDLIITAELAAHTYQLPVVKISPFLQKKDLQAIQQTCAQLAQEKKQTKLRAYLDWYFPSELFFYAPTSMTKEAIITFLVQKLTTFHYVDAAFETEIWKREAMSNTAFGHVAMPHTLNYNALKTRIAIVVQPKPIDWGEQQVQIICLIAVNQKDKKSFGPLFQTVISVLSEAENVVQLVQTTEHGAFIERLVQMMDSEPLLYD